MIRLFIGYDPRETVAWHVLSHSILARSSAPVAITPLALNNLGAQMWRERSPLQSTDFAFSRFLTPWLCGFEGWSIFMDCDMLVRDDIARLWELRDDRYAVMCVKHDHVPTETVKFLNAPQTAYAKKNWSSVMLFNNARCRALSPEYVNAATGLQLHQFKWLESESLIGEIPHGWNHLVGFDAYDPDAANVHFTDGGPYFHEHANCDYAQEWFAEQQRMLRVDQRETVGKLVVAEPVIAPAGERRLADAARR
ncbi:MAG: glycosyltransferase [Piscinibacter sp.]|uniref:glycosyltransferase n=1 Tax=Piscinibacter sp. TaxID=1903157 RepID=UPI003D13F58C